MEISSPSAASTTCALVMTTPPRVSARKPVPCASPAWILNTLRLKRAKSVAAGSTRASDRLGAATPFVTSSRGYWFVLADPHPGTGAIVLGTVQPQGRARETLGATLPKEEGPGGTTNAT